MSTLDKHMLKELLLVCSALGSVETSETAGGDGENSAGQQQRFVRGENCLEWLQDLQRCAVKLCSSFVWRAYPPIRAVFTAVVKTVFFQTDWKRKPTTNQRYHTEQTAVVRSRTLQHRT